MIGLAQKSRERGHRGLFEQKVRAHNLDFSVFAGEV
jgi:hypothetical protein